MSNIENRIMSGDLIWVGDLDDYVDIGAINDEWSREEEARERRADFNAIGELALFDGKAVSADLLEQRGVEPGEWQWALRQAGTALNPYSSNQELEALLVRALLSLGRRYAIIRYARWEGAPIPSAQTASLPLGLKALLYQYLSGQGIRKPQQYNKQIEDVLQAAASLKDGTAYRRAGMVQSLLHEIARRDAEHATAKPLDREATRLILSLSRLHFSVAEIQLNSFTALSELSAAYSKARKAEETLRHSTSRRFIRNWRLRHLRPLTELFPIAIRYGLERGISHFGLNKELTHEAALNELALAHCGVLLMRRTAYRYAAERTLRTSRE